MEIGSCILQARYALWNMMIALWAQKTITQPQSVDVAHEGLGHEVIDDIYSQITINTAIISIYYSSESHKNTIPFSATTQNKHGLSFREIESDLYVFGGDYISIGLFWFFFRPEICGATFLLFTQVNMFQSVYADPGKTNMGRQGKLLEMGL
ncbi:hypothetical protein ACJX0J_010131, partial [Zea mays]